MRYDALIIGGGISGLSLAHGCCRRGLRTLVLEGAPRLGGCIATYPVPGTNRFWVEAGAHTCYNSYGHALDLIADLGLTPTLKHRVSFKLLHQGSLRSLLAGLHPLELALSLPRLLWEAKAGRSVEDYYTRVLGQQNYRDLFGPAFNAVLCQSADAYPADLLFRPKPKRKGYPRSFTFPEGLSSIPETIAKQPGLEVLTGALADSIHREGTDFRIFTANGRTFTARVLALAVPPDQAALLLDAGFPELAARLGAIPMAEIESVSVAIPSEALRLPPLAGIIAPRQAFYSAVSRDYLPDPALRGFTFHFHPERLDPEGQMQRICEVLGVTQEQIAMLARYTHRLPILRVGHGERVARIDKLLAGTGLLLTGNYFLGVSLEDCLTRSASELRRIAPDGGVTQDVAPA